MLFRWRPCCTVLTLRAYTSSDVIGVELGGAVRTCWPSPPASPTVWVFGANARAALITRGLAEMVRLGVAVGGQRETFIRLGRYR